jgi:hypothetical protein
MTAAEEQEFLGAGLANAGEAHPRHISLLNDDATGWRRARLHRSLKLV